jgi:hypothetical protein
MAKKDYKPSVQDELHELPQAERDAILKSYTRNELQDLKTDYMSELKSERKMLAFNDKLFFASTASGAAAAIGAVEVAGAVLPHVFDSLPSKTVRKAVGYTVAAGAGIGLGGYLLSKYLFRPNLVATIEQMETMIGAIDRELGRKESQGILITSDQPKNNIEANTAVRAKLEEALSLVQRR